MYEGSLYRPPSEARSVIIQVTVGCSHNKCTFCSMYKDKSFRVKSMEEIRNHIQHIKMYHSGAKRVFLADGDALILDKDKLIEIITIVKKEFPNCERITSYATPRDILHKSEEELQELKEAGLDMLYMGIESGSDKILSQINKGVSSDEIVQAGLKAKGCGIKLSVTLISGVGGKQLWKEHAKESAEVINKINPEYLGLLTLMIEPGTELYEDMKEGRFQLLNPKEVMMETYTFIKSLFMDGCLFRSNHASNYLSLGGKLPEDKEDILSILEEALEGDIEFKKDMYRGL